MDSEFNAIHFERKLTTLKDSQESINNLSSWCLENRHHHKKIVQCWLNVLKRVKVEHRLILFYLANDVIQYSKRKNYEFVESWGTTLQKATTLVREDKVKHRILRIFKIWEQRNIYGEEFLADLTGLISVAPAKKTEDSIEFQPSYLISKIRGCTKLEEETDTKLKELKEHEKAIVWDDTESVLASLKDRKRVEDVEKEIDDSISHIETVTKALNAEIKSRRYLLNLLSSAEEFYSTQKGEVKIVANAYKNFSNRVKNLKKRIEEMLADETRWLSPVPSPDVNAPSPGPDSDIDLPDSSSVKDKSNDFPTMNANFYQENTFKNAPSSFIGTNIPFNIHQSNLFSDTTNNIQSHHHHNNSLANNLIEVVGGQNNSQGGLNNKLNQQLPNIDSLNNIIKQFLPPSNDLINQHDSYLQNSRPSTHQPLLPPPLPPSLDNLNPSSSNSSIDNNYMVSNSYNQQIYASTSNNSVYNSSTNYNQSYTTNTHVPPPPPSTSYQVGVDEYNPEEDLELWETDAQWPEGLDLETPESPPSYEKEPISDPVECHGDGGPVVNNILVSHKDVDHRVLSMPTKRNADTDHRISRQTSKDIDHRNLISLTGSPSQQDDVQRTKKQPLNFSLGQNLWESQINSNDRDYRAQPIQDQDYRTGSTNSNNTSTPILQSQPPFNPDIVQHLVSLTSEPPPPPPPSLVNFTNPNFQNNLVNLNQHQNPFLSHYQPPPPPPPLLMNQRQNSSSSNYQNQNDNIESIDMDLSDDETAMYKRHLGKKISPPPGPPPLLQNLDDLFNNKMNDRFNNDNRFQNNKRNDNNNSRYNNDRFSNNRFKKDRFDNRMKNQQTRFERNNNFNKRQNSDESNAENNKRSNVNNIQIQPLTDISPELIDAALRILPATQQLEELSQSPKIDEMLNALDSEEAAIEAAAQAATVLNPLDVLDGVEEKEKDQQEVEKSNNCVLENDLESSKESNEFDKGNRFVIDSLLDDEEKAYLEDLEDEHNNSSFDSNFQNFNNRGGARGMSRNNRFFRSRGFPRGGNLFRGNNRRGRGNFNHRGGNGGGRQQINGMRGNWNPRARGGISERGWRG